ncbi:serine/threonine-protein kinase [Streptomyces xiamenensis]|nr:serine/threonine-protein kinase [Streptomyces xiamenensis]
MIPERIGRYVVVRELGTGGMGEVFLAYSPAGAPVAVKLIRGDRLDPHARQRFEREALIARTVSGTDRVARFLDADPYADRPWMAMEYVPGGTLLEGVDEHGPLPPALVASAGALLAEGLSAVHAVGLLHRDLKPQNVIMGEGGPSIIDFGLGAITEAGHATLTRSGVVIGTIRCMPPEQALGEGDPSPAGDVYGLGTVLLYAASGHYPYDGNGWEAVHRKVVLRETAPDLSGLPAGPLHDLLAAMLAHDPHARPGLEEVGEICATLLRDAGLSPALGRRALITRTFRPAETAPEERMTPSIEERLRRLEEQFGARLDEDALDAVGAPRSGDADAPAEPGASSGAHGSGSHRSRAADGPGEPGAPAASGRSPEQAAQPGPAAGTTHPETDDSTTATGARQLTGGGHKARLPASRRVADELRAAYATGPQL